MKTEIISRIPLMRLSHEQNGAMKDSAFIPRTEGLTALCVDVRRYDSGSLECVALPRRLTTVSETPIFTDTRAGITYLFTINDARQLSIAGAINSDGSYEDISETLGILGADFRSAATVGQFLVLSLADDTLCYLLWHADLGAYTFLGALPTLPDISLERGGTYQLTETIPSRSFQTLPDDLRVGVEDDIASDAIDDVAGAYKRLATRARELGLWLQPVVVRLAMRLWDGSLLELSQPLVAPEAGYQGGGRTVLPLIANGSNYSGTAETTLTATGYKLRLHLGGLDLKRWNDVVRSVEVWVSEEQNPFDGAATPAVSYYSGSQGAGLAVTLYLRSRVAMAEEMAGLDMRRVAVSGLSSVGSTLTLSCRPEARRGRPFQEERGKGPVHASVVEGHDGFLHLARLREYYDSPVMPQGDPGSAAKSLCRVAVRLGPEVGGKWVVAEGYIAGNEGKIIPYLRYPSARAEMMVVSILGGSGDFWQESFELKSEDTGEDAAIYATGSFAPVALPEVEQLEHPEAGNIVASALQIGKVMTMRRGNPFVAISSTGQVGGEVHCLKAQRIGGGAYTRQFLYAFTDRGVVAITHDYLGRHTNSRMIGHAVVVESENIVATDHGLYATDRKGTLLQLKDCRAKNLLRGLSDVRALGWDSRFDELWVFFTEGGRSLALALTDGQTRAEGSLRSLNPASLVGREGMLLWSAPWGRNFRVYTEGGEHRGVASRIASGRWCSRAFDHRLSPTGWVRFDVECGSNSADMTLFALHPVIDAGANPEDDGFEIDRLSLSEANGVMPEMPLWPGGCQTRGPFYRERFRLRLAGPFIRFAALRP